MQRERAREEKTMDIKSRIIWDSALTQRVQRRMQRDEPDTISRRIIITTTKKKTPPNKNIKSGGREKKKYEFNEYSIIN